MALMYDTIMELPLFKGISEEQLSLMLEKTSVDFLKFTDGEEINASTDTVATIDFIIKGKVRNIYKMKNFPIEIEEILGEGSMIGVLHLYGLDTTYGATAFAKGEVSIMRIEKSQYMNILLSDRIYILNFVNYLSAAAQKPLQMTLSRQKPSIKQSLDILAYSVASRRAESIRVIGSDEAIAEYCGVTKDEYIKWRSSQ